MLENYSKIRLPRVVEVGTGVRFSDAEAAFLDSPTGETTHVREKNLEPDRTY
jgi:hypothetical protein